MNKNIVNISLPYYFCKIIKYSMCGKGFLQTVQVVFKRLLQSTSILYLSIPSHISCKYNDINKFKSVLHNVHNAKVAWNLKLFNNIVDMFNIKRRQKQKNPGHLVN